MANLIQWEPFGEMVSLRDAMAGLMEESFLRPGALGSPEASGVVAPIDIYETDDGLELKAAVPGVKPEEIEVTITGDVLTIKGEYKQEEQAAKRNYLRQERRFGSFCRQLTLPPGIDSGKVHADFENGVLTLTMPKAESVKPKSIRVTAK